MHNYGQTVAYVQVELEFGNVGFYGGRKTVVPGKNPRSKDENQQQTQPTYDTGTGNRTRATMVEGECSHYCAIPAPHHRRHRESNGHGKLTNNERNN